ncbi:MAG: lipid-binding SYLF domain-containing protein [Acidobacteriaceae bacterium]
MIQLRHRIPHFALAALALSCALTPLIARAADEDADTARITASGDVLKELLDSPSGISHDLLNKAYCVIILPSVKKGGFILAAEYGRGCRSGDNFDGAWGAPIMMQSSGGSIGFQIGGQATDFVVLVMNDQGARAVMNGKAKLGSDASVAAGPVGRTAEASTNASMSAEMLSYSRSQGVFAGISLSGTSLGPDSNSNEKIYGKPVTGREIFSGSVQPPAAASTLLSTIQATSPQRTR